MAEGREATAAPARPRRRVVVLGVLLPFAALALVDAGLALAGWRPPDAPALFYARTRGRAFDPFVSTPEGSLAIRPDWVSDGSALRGTRGERAGRQYLVPGFRPAELAPRPAAGVRRVVALGGSTTFGLYVGADAAFPAVLARALDDASGDATSVEGVNLGCPGFASDRVAALLERALALSPDLVVVLTGHNEMLGGPDPLAASPALRARVWLLERSALFAWLDRGLAGLLRGGEARVIAEDAAALAAGRIPTWVPEEVPPWERRAPGAAARERSARALAHNVARMAERAREARVPLLVAVPAANLRSPPAVSLHAPGFDAHGPFEAAFREGRDALRDGRPDAAREALERAVALSPHHAAAHHHLGEALLALGREDAARRAFRRAVDRDVRTHRITSGLEDALVAAIRREGLVAVDLRPLFHADLSRETLDALFLDHLHPTDAGHARIARALAPPARRLLAGEEVAAGLQRPAAGPTPQASAIQAQ